MKKLPVLTCKNNHVLASRVTTVLIASLILASTFIITSPLFAQSASFTSNRLPKFTEVDPTLIGCTEQSTQINTHAVKSMLFLKSKKVPFTTITNLSGSDCKAQWNPAADVAKKGCDFLTYYPPTDPSYHLMSDPTLPFWYQFNSFGEKNIPLQLLPVQEFLSSTLVYDLQSITFQLSSLQDNQKKTLSLAPFYFQCTGQNSPDGGSKTNSQGYTFKFAISNQSRNPDGWCNTMPDDKTYLCSLRSNQTINLSENGNGSSMMEGSSKPLYEGELPYCWPSWFPNPPSTPAPYSYYCGFFQKALQDVSSLSLKNSQNYTFRFTVADPSKNQDGWCNTTSDSKTYLCSLESGNAKNVHLSEGVDGSSIMNGSPKPLSESQIPFCWPSWFANPPANPTPQPHTAGQYNYYCGFFKPDSANPTVTPVPTSPSKPA